MLPEAEKAKYKEGLTKLPASGRGGMRAWVPASTPCLPPAPTTTAVPGRAHHSLPATPAPPPTRAAPSAAPTAPPVAPPPLPSDLAQMFDEPIGLGAAPAEPSAPSMAPTPSMAPMPSMAILAYGHNNMTPEQQAISVALRCIQVARTDVEVCKVARTLAYALGATRAEVGTIKALHGVLLQMTRPGMSDMEAIKFTKASKSNFVLWKRKVLVHPRAPVSAPCLPPAPTTTAVSAPGLRWAAALANRFGGPKLRRSSSSSVSTISSAYSCAPSYSSDDSGPEPGNTATLNATHAPPPTRPAPPTRAAPPTAPTAQLGTPPPLPADLAQMFDDEPIGLGTTPAAPLAASAAPAVSSHSWLEQQQLAEMLEEELTGVEAVEVSKV